MLVASGDRAPLEHSLELKSFLRIGAIDLLSKESFGCWMEWNQFKVFIIWAQVSKDLFEGVEFGTFSINICLVDLRKENLRWHDDGTQKSIDNSSQLNNPTLKKNCVTIVSVPS